MQIHADQPRSVRVDMCGDELFLEDHGLTVPPDLIRTGKRVGINSSREGFDAPLRFLVRASDVLARGE